MSWYKIEKYIKIGTLSHELKAIEEEHDKQIRADAINECIEALGNNIWDIAKLEQLKEQK